MVAEIGQPSNCAQVAFSDNFDGTSLNSNKWFAYEYYSNGTATLENGSLKFTIPSGKTNWPKMFAITEDKVTLEGDFVQEITVKSLASTPTDQLSSFVLGLVAVKPDNPKYWYRAEIYSNGDIQTYGTTDGVTTSGTAVNAFKNTPTKLKMVRKGSTLTTYYDSGNGYVLHHTLNNIFTGKMFVQLIALSHSSAYPSMNVLVDDYKLNCLPPLPTNLSHSCSADGKKVTFKWDDNSPSKKYHFGLDDIIENDDDWYKPGTTDVWRGGDYASNSYELPIIPGREYKWWINTNLDYTTKSESITKTFKCEPKPPSPTNLRHTCNPDGKSVRLMWDGITDADYYKLRVDDKKGNITSTDGIVGKTEYVATIKSGETYSWWTHSTKSNYDSLESERKDFKCTATSIHTPTSTPKPTVKATVKPTLTPEPSPTSTPKISPTTTPRMSPTNPSYSPPSDENAVDDTPEKVVSKNPIARFFNWLASLFE